MHFSPQILLSTSSRQRCLINLKNLPPFKLFRDLKSKSKASVLVPLCVDNGELCLLYTLRSSHMSNYRGEVAFPGGKIDRNETVYEAALREAKEEIGVDAKDFDIWDKMPIVEDKTVIITPILGLIKNFNMSKLEHNLQEVDHIFRVSLKTLCNTEQRGYFNYKGLILPVYLHENYKIWGLTGLITNMFLKCFLHKNVYTGDFKKKQFNWNDLIMSTGS